MGEGALRERVLKIVILKYDPEAGVETFVVKGDLEKIVKQKLLSVVESEWSPSKNELMVFGDKLTLEFPLPLTPEQFDLLQQFDLRKEGNVAVASVPYYIIVFPKYGYPGSPQVVYMIAPYLGEEKLEEMKEMIKDVAKEKGEE